MSLTTGHEGVRCWAVHVDSLLLKRTVETYAFQGTPALMRTEDHVQISKTASTQHHVPSVSIYGNSQRLHKTVLAGVRTPALWVLRYETSREHPGETSFYNNAARNEHLPTAAKAQ